MNIHKLDTSVSPTEITVAPAVIFTLLGTVFFQAKAFAADAAPISATGSMFKMLMGLAIVLAVMGLITWVLKRMMPGVGGQPSVIRVIGSASVGSRERVVVVEVGDRWLVVGVAPGQVTSIANLEAGDSKTAQVLTQGGLPNSNIPGFAQPMVNSFAGWLKQSSDKFKHKSED